MSGPLGDHNLDLPFEAVPPGQYVTGADLLGDGHLAGGLHEWTAWQSAPEPSRDGVARESRHCTEWGCDAVQIRPVATDLAGEVEHLLLDNVRHWGNQLVGSGSGNLNCSLKDAAAAVAHWLELDDDIVLAAVAHQRDVLSDENLRLRGQVGEMAEEIQRLEADLAVAVHEATTARAKVAADE